MLPVGLRRVSFVDVCSRVRREFTQRLNTHIAKVISDGFLGSNVEGWPYAWENYKGSAMKAEEAWLSGKIKTLRRAAERECDAGQYLAY
jgi:hypothetical protein